MFDRITLLVAATGILVMAAILVLVVRGPISRRSRVSTAPLAEIELTEFSISGDLAVPEGPVTLRVTNAGNIAHNLTPCRWTEHPGPQRRRKRQPQPG